MRDLRVLLGGPWYGCKVDARLAQSLAQFCVGAVPLGVLVDDIVFADGLLDLSRNRLLAQAIAAGVDWLVSIDSDCSFKDQYVAICDALKRWKRTDVAILAAPVKRGDGGWNVLDLDERTIAELPKTAGPVGSVGFGFVAFNTGWYSLNWPRVDRHWAPFFQTIVYPDPLSKWGMGAWGEDYGHCKAVRDKGGKIIVDPAIRVPHHCVRPGHPAAKDE
jgi:hypothetical protein